MAVAGAEVAVGSGVAVGDAGGRVGSGARVAMDMPPAPVDSLSAREASVAGWGAVRQPKPRLSVRTRQTARRLSGHKAGKRGDLIEVPEAVEQALRRGVT